MDIILFLAGIFLLIFILGRFLEKARIPWIFSAMVLGLILAAYNPFEEITSSSSFHLLAQLGMYFLLFIIGLELDIKRLFNRGSFVVKTTMVIVLTEAFLGSLVVHFVFGIPWVISIVVALSFATVGEAVLLPILQEFKLLKTKLGQTLLGIGVLDDVFEVLTIIIASILLGRSAGITHTNILLSLVILGSLFGLAFTLVRFHKYFESFKYKDVPSAFLFLLFLLFLFIGIGNFVQAAALGALLAGIAIKNIVPKRILRAVDSEIKIIAYGFFAPIFFLWVGIDTDLSYIKGAPLLVLLVVLVAAVAKIGSSLVMGHRVLGVKASMVLGVGLSVKFSTSIVIVKLLYEQWLISPQLYSVLVGATSLIAILVPASLSWMITSLKIKA